MNKYAIAIIAMCFVGMSLAEEEPQLHYTLISPSAYTADWQEYLDMRRGQRPDVAFDLVNAADIYAAYPFDPAATDGVQRNPAESIHAWIRAKMRGITDPTERAKHYFVLGGSFVDAQTITVSDDERLQKYIPGVYVRPRFSPDDNIQVGEPYYSISDMFYACLDVKDGEWPWDANKNGKYADNQESGTNLNDYIADVVVARIPVEKHPSGAKTVIAAFKEKVARVEDLAFAGCYRFALAGGQCSNKGGRVNITDGNTLRDEHEFYDGGLNMFDPRHGGMWIDSELVPRRTVKNTTVMKRPVLEGNPMFMYTWGADHATIEDAVKHFYSHNYDYLEYRDHGSASDLYCKYINADAYLKATGLTRMIISGFSCMTGYIDGPGVSLAEAEILSPEGGTVASVHNSRYGVNWAGTDLKDNAGLSSTLQYLTKQGVLEKNMDLGQAWLYARQQFGATADLALFVSAEQLLLGDPLIKLSPPVLEKTLDETEIAVTEDTGYTTLNVKGGTTIAGKKLFKVMQGLNVTSYGNLTFAADGGVGGSGVSFANGEGTLTIASPSKSYFVQPTGAKEVVLAGSGTTLDFEQATPKFEALTLRGEGETRRTGNVLRGRAEGQLKGFVPFAVENTEVALGTVDAFKDANPEVFAKVTKGGLGITFNPNYGLENSWEYFTGSINLDNGALFVDRTTTAGFGRDKSGLVVAVKGETSVETRNGGKATVFGTTTFNLEDDATLKFGAAILRDEKTDGKIVINGGTTIVEDEVGLSGEVVVNDGILKLTKIPLVNVTKLTLSRDSKLMIPYDERGFYQILENGATLELNGAEICSLNNPTEAIVGELTTTCAFFDAAKFLVWNKKGGGDWNLETDNKPWIRSGKDSAFSLGMKVCFPDIAYSAVNQVHTIKLTDELNCEYVYFGNHIQKYKFTGAKLNLRNLQVGTEVEFSNEVYAPRGTIAAKDAKLTVANLTTPTLDIADGAVVDGLQISDKITTIKGFRLVFGRPVGGGLTIGLSEVRFYDENEVMKAINKDTLRSSKESTNIESLFDDRCHPFHCSANTDWNMTMDNLAEFDNDQCYLEYMSESGIPILKSFGIAQPHEQAGKVAPSTWKLLVTVDGETWTNVASGAKSSYVGPSDGLVSFYWYLGSDQAYKVDAARQTDISIASGGSLALKGEVAGSIHLSDGAILKAVTGEKLTLDPGSSIKVPESGYAVIDVSDLELENIGEEGLTVLSGITLTEDELGHLTTRGQSYYNLIVEDDALKLEIHKRPPRVLFK